MKTTIKRVFGVVMLLMFFASAHAQYTEVMNKQGVTFDMKKDYSLVDDHAKSNQSELIQKAVDELSAKGGGCLIIPKGTYLFSNIWMKNNVHVLIERGTYIKAYWPKGEIVDVFKFDAKKDFEYVENISVRGLGGTYTIDYTDHDLVRGEGARFVNVGQVKNFYIADAVVYDNYTTFCAIAVGLSKIVDINQKPRFRPTYGTVKNISIYNSGEGYGLTQLHRADHLYLENLYAKGGGITLRLETGGGGIHAGVHDVYAKNIVCYEGRQALMMGPHTAQNGTVGIDGITAINCAWAVTIGNGFIDRKHEGVAEAKLGRFADDSYVRNIRAVYGEDAIVLSKRIDEYPVESVPKFRAPESPNMWSFRGPSLGAVENNAESYKVSVENSIEEGFPAYSEASRTANLGKNKDEILKDVQDWEVVKILFKRKKDKSVVLSEKLMTKYFNKKGN